MPPTGSPGGGIYDKFQHVPPPPEDVVYWGRLEVGPNQMTAETPPNPPRSRVRSLSIGQMTFGSFMLVLAVIVVTGAASVIAIRHIDQTFGELQRLQSVGDLAEDIDRRMNELRLAARAYVTDSSARAHELTAGATAISDL